MLMFNFVICQRPPLQTSGRLHPPIALEQKNAQASAPPLLLRRLGRRDIEIQRPPRRHHAVSSEVVAAPLYDRIRVDVAARIQNGKHITACIAMDACDITRKQR
eukprot:5859444-Pyramimonas_sp.AAC.1